MHENEVYLASGRAGILISMISGYYFLKVEPSDRDLQEKKRNKFKEQIKNKIKSNINLEASEIANIGRGLDLSYGNAIEALYKLYAEAEDEENHKQYKKLIEDINRTEPFESLPEEARPSLARLAAICQTSNQESDKELLLPIKKLLDEYQEMKRDHIVIKRRNRISYVVALVSIFLGAVGLILAFTGPSKDFIQKEIKKSTEVLKSEIQGNQGVKEEGHEKAE